MEKALKYKTSRISFLENYFFALVIITILFISLPFLRIGSEPLHYFIFFLSLIFAIALIEEPEIRRYFRTYFVTNNEVIKIEGIIRKSKVSIPYQNVSSVTYKKSVLGRILNFGDILISADGDKIKMIGIRNPEEVAKIIENKISLVRKVWLKQK